ncbi:hypothetical protein THAOC_26055, partial [Thalassiosira oceanica]
MKVEQRDSGTGITKASRITLLDLAGSELGAPGARDGRRRRRRGQDDQQEPQRPRPVRLDRFVEPARRARQGDHARGALPAVEADARPPGRVRGQLPDGHHTDGEPGVVQHRRVDTDDEVRTRGADGDESCEAPGGDVPHGLPEAAAGLPRKAERAGHAGQPAERRVLPAQAGRDAGQVSGEGLRRTALGDDREHTRQRRDARGEEAQRRERAGRGGQDQGGSEQDEGGIEDVPGRAGRARERAVRAPVRGGAAPDAKRQRHEGEEEVLQGGRVDEERDPAADAAQAGGGAQPPNVAVSRVRGDGVPPPVPPVLPAPPPEQGRAGHGPDGGRHRARPRRAGPERPHRRRHPPPRG